MPEQEDKMISLPAIDMAATGKNIAKMRQNAGLTVKDLQIFFGFATPQAIYKWQHGTAMPTIDNLVALAMIFGVTMDDIIVVDTDVRAQISA
jgi:transcriptional regulator with XRE-family HTH domain